MEEELILAVDQGTSSTKTLIFDPNGRILARGSAILKSYFPQPGFVEQVPEEIYGNAIESVGTCLENFKSAGGKIENIRACGISNQRETLLIWDKNGEPLYNAIVWQCKRSVDICQRLKKEGLEGEINKRTGLIIDPYFSGSKMIWLMENEEKIRTAVRKGDVYFGTVDTWLLYKLTDGREYKTDYTNASRTLFFNLDTLDWDKDLLKLFGLENLNLPEVLPSSSGFGVTHFEGLLETPVPVTGMIGDSHAAAFGEGCYHPGSAKATLGTGSSILLNTGDTPVFSKAGMVTTICWSVGDRVDYALEGIIVTCGGTIEWLKNQLGLFSDSSLTDKMAQSVDDNNGVYFVPAFSGLGAPHWKMDAKAIITGLTFGANKNHIVRAALESIPFQIKDVISTMETESYISLQELKVDGGISKNRFVVQLLADILETKVSDTGITDVSALGAALIAGWGANIVNSIDEISIIEDSLINYRPGQESIASKKAYEGWRRAINSHFC